MWIGEFDPERGELAGILDEAVLESDGVAAPVGLPVRVVAPAPVAVVPLARRILALVGPGSIGSVPRIVPLVRGATVPAVVRKITPCRSDRRSDSRRP